jgi:hypothetical protein
MLSEIHCRKGTRPFHPSAGVIPPVCRSSGLLDHLRGHQDAALLKHGIDLLGSLIDSRDLEIPEKTLNIRVRLELGQRVRQIGHGDVFFNLKTSVVISAIREAGTCLPRTRIVPAA